MNYINLRFTSTNCGYIIWCYIWWVRNRWNVRFYCRQHVTSVLLMSRCWLSEENGAIWAFIAPMLIIILVRIFVVQRIISLLIHHSSTFLFWLLHYGGYTRPQKPILLLNSIQKLKLLSNNKLINNNILRRMLKLKLNNSLHHYAGVLLKLQFSCNLCLAALGSLAFSLSTGTPLLLHMFLLF